eukprot:m.57182 g.57182  ORF g.57182 m.57182 type:complete len:65 (-) comp11589_c0_seq1:1512-1706(-)
MCLCTSSFYLHAYDLNIHASADQDSLKVRGVHVALVPPENQPLFVLDQSTIQRHQLSYCAYDEH